MQQEEVRTDPADDDSAPAPVPDEGPEGRWRRLLPWAPLIVVGLTILFNLIVLAPNILTTHYANDSSVHVSMAKWAALRIQEGHLPFDGWYPYLDLGASRFHHYQSLPAIVTGALGVVVGTEGAFHWILYLMLALWPLCIYWSARLLGWGKWPSALAAVVSPLAVSQPSLGYEWGSYTWAGYGVYTQMWGMWLLPLSWAFTWRAVSGRGPYWPAALVAGLTIAAHLLTGYLALLVIGVWVLIKPSEFLRRVGRAVVVGVGSLAAVAWLIVPLVQDSKWTTQDPFSRNNVTYDSFGALKVLRWLGTGALFDNNRWPAVTILAAVGVVVCIARFRRDERARALLGAEAVCLLLFFGRPTLGPVLDLLPGSGDLFLRRYVFGVHLGGFFLAGVGAAWLGKAAFRWARRSWSGERRRLKIAFGVTVFLLVAFLAPAFAERGNYGLRQYSWIMSQRHLENTDGADLRALIAKAESLGPGRFFAGQGRSWGKAYTLGVVPLDIELLYAMTDAVGFHRPTWSLSSPITQGVTASDFDIYQLFDMKYVIEPKDALPLVASRHIMDRGRWTLWQVTTSGYFDLVDSTHPAVEADRTNLRANMEDWMRSDLVSRKLFPAIAFAGAPPPPATDTPQGGPRGTILQQIAKPEDGYFEATVNVDRRTFLMLKSSFDPRWRITIDGREVEPQMIAPSYVGHVLDPGRHHVVMEYAPYPNYLALFVVSIGSVVGLAFWDRSRRRKRGGQWDPIGSGGPGRPPPPIPPLVEPSPPLVSPEPDGDGAGPARAGPAADDGALENPTGAGRKPAGPHRPDSTSEVDAGDEADAASPPAGGSAAGEDGGTDRA
jgi:hypothetical protein